LKNHESQWTAGVPRRRDIVTPKDEIYTTMRPGGQRPAFCIAA